MLLLQRTYKGGVPGGYHLFVEGIIAALLGATFAAWLFPREASVIAVFLASVSTTDSIERLLKWNRDQIFHVGQQPRKANLSLVFRLLCLFAGAATGFSILALGLSLETVEVLFSSQLHEYGSNTLQDLQFGHPLNLLVHNTYVLLFFFVIAIPFRQGGVMLAVAWNASVWAAAFSSLAKNWSFNGGPGLLEAYTRIVAACVPHMAMEAASYCLAGLAGVFLSKALLKYSLESEELTSVMKSVGMMLGLAIFLVILGAAWEGLLASWLVSLLTGNG